MYYVTEFAAIYTTATQSLTLDSPLKTVVSVNTLMVIATKAYVNTLCALPLLFAHVFHR